MIPQVDSLFNVIIYILLWDYVAWLWDTYACLKHTDGGNLRERGKQSGGSSPKSERKLNSYFSHAG